MLLVASSMHWLCGCVWLCGWVGVWVGVGVGVGVRACACVCVCVRVCMCTRACDGVSDCTPAIEYGHIAEDQTQLDFCPSYCAQHSHPQTSSKRPCTHINTHTHM